MGLPASYFAPKKTPEPVAVTLAPWLTESVLAEGGDCCPLTLLWFHPHSYRTTAGSRLLVFGLQQQGLGKEQEGKSALLT